jgi:hypothetical protein
MMDSQEIRLIIKGKEVMIDAIQYYRILADIVANTYEVLYSFYIPFRFQEEMDMKYLEEVIEITERDMEAFNILLSGTEYEENEHFSSYYSSVKEVIEKMRVYMVVTADEFEELLNNTEQTTRNLHKITDELLQFIGSVRKKKGIFKESQSMIAKRFYKTDFDGNIL